MVFSDQPFVSGNNYRVCLRCFELLCFSNDDGELRPYDGEVIHDVIHMLKLRIRNDEGEKTVYFFERRRWRINADAGENE